MLKRSSSYDETIGALRRSLEAAKVEHSDKRDGLRRLDRFVRAVERRFAADADFDALVAHERAISPSLGGRTVFDDRRRHSRQPRLF